MLLYFIHCQSIFDQFLKEETYPFLFLGVVDDQTLSFLKQRRAQKPLK